jgi:hypothetical protein
VRRDLCILANGENPLSSNGNGIGDREAGIDRDYFGVLENQVGRSSRRN